ncbi:Mediator complex subunit Med4 [Trinorchestia longiramus]|nr:Mediator complex subunit Med4 [Trinorchestia longiramus]
MSSVSTKETLLTLIDDVEIICRQLVDNSVAPKHQKLSGQELHAVVQLLISKDSELKKTIKVASDQAAVEKVMSGIQAELAKVDSAIHNLEQQLYDAHHKLSMGLYQARQKLKIINAANKRPVNSEDLVRYAHRISSTSAVSAPATWQQGDPRRPYPTDLEMRAGALGQHGGLLHSQHHLSESLLQRHHSTDSNSSGVGVFAWQPSGECAIVTGGGVGGSGGGSSAPHTTALVQKKQQDDVEVMSTDSSSSSSSDSQ